MINGVNSASYSKSIAEPKKTNNMPSNDKKTESKTDIVDIGKNNEKTNTYSKPVTYKPNIEEISRLRQEANNATQSLRDLVESLLTRQGKTLKDVQSGKETLVVDEKARVDAEQLISEDGDLGVKKTAERILQFAKALSGGDKNAIPKIKEAIQQGFKDAEKILGKLPDISQKTYDEVMKGLDAWSQE